MENPRQRVKQHEVYLVSYANGVITCISPTGQVEEYIKRNVHKYSKEKLDKAIKKRLIPKNYKIYPEFPKEYKLINEEPAVLGRVYVTLTDSQIDS